MEKRLLRSNFSSFFHNIFNITLIAGVKLKYSFVKCAVRFIVFLSSANLICRGTDISKRFRESLGIQDNESRLYFSHVMNTIREHFDTTIIYLLVPTKRPVLLHFI